jgi:hypothetical protein
MLICCLRQQFAVAKRLAGARFHGYARSLDGPALGHFTMKAKIEIDCTPIEARDFLGLPDVKPMQEAMMDQMQAKMQENIANFTPEALMRTWFSFDPKVAERFQDMFMNMTGLGARKDK